MRKIKERLLAVALTLILSLGMLGMEVGAVGISADRAVKSPTEYDGHNVTLDTSGRYYLSISSVSNKNVWNYKRTNVSINGTALAVNGIIINNTHYIPARAAANVLGAAYSYNSADKTAKMTLSGLELIMTAGCYVSYGNERALFSMTPNVLMSDGRLYVPASSFVKAIGMKAVASNTSLSVTGSYKPLVHARDYYREDEVFWLGRIIHAEAEGEPLLGKIAVGNVVLNRVRSNYYPNTIYGVIFDRKYGVQFSPVLDGTIYNSPGYNSTLAAKICLEGFDVANGAFFFLEPSLSTSSWIPKNRDYTFTIGNHDFYK